MASTLAEPDAARPRTAAATLVEALIAQGITHVFCVPGESYLAVLDALVDRRDAIRVVTCRHESGAANMAEAYGKLTGRPGVCMVTRGPGAANAAIGIHTAQHDSTPLVMFVGQVARGVRGRGAFQEVDYPATFGSLAKGAFEVDEPARMGEIVHRAFSVALQGRRGPVVVALPEDVLDAIVATVPAEPVPTRPAGLEPTFAADVVARLDAAERPLLILGGSGWTDDALDALVGWAEAAALPVVLSFRRKDLWDNGHPCYAGDIGFGLNPRLAERFAHADVLLAIGTRLGDVATQDYTLLSREDAAAKLIHIHAGPEEIGRVWPVRLGAVADVNAAAHALAARPLRADWTDWCTGAHAEQEAYSAPIAASGAVNLSALFAGLGALAGPDAIVCNGAGNYAAWLHRFHRHRRRRTQLAPTSGAMGYGFPASVAAKLLHPERTVIAVAGDGCFLMTGQELATAMQHDVAIIVLVVDNGAYGTIRMHQERHYPGRVSATELRNPDFVAYARSFGAWAIAVERTEDFAPALADALAAGRPALLHVKTPIRDIAPGQILADA